MASYQPSPFAILVCITIPEEGLDVGDVDGFLEETYSPEELKRLNCLTQKLLRALKGEPEPPTIAPGAALLQAGRRTAERNQHGPNDRD